jgi:hypothetical protein
MLNRQIRIAGRRAKKIVEAAHPSFTTCGALLRADEPQRYVFAVFFEEPTVMTRPTRYKLVAVSRDFHILEELDPPHESEYWIRGRK